MLRKKEEIGFSVRSVLNGVKINFGLCLFNFLNLSFILGNPNYLFLTHWFFDCSKMIGLTYLMETSTGTKSKPPIISSKRLSMTSWSDWGNMVILAALNTKTNLLLIDQVNIQPVATIYTVFWAVGKFIWVSFIFEILFDFFHYWGHRLMHLSPWLYQKVHKVHHAYANPSASKTFHMSILDYLLSHCLPLSLSILILSRWVNLSLFELVSINTYLIYGEIAGHIGRKMYPTSSFCQLIYLPRILGIDLYTEDHHLHHMKLNCNYGKRFSLWDRVFNTYQPYYS